MKQLISAVLLCCAAALFAGQIYFKGDSVKNPLSYRCGEEIEFRLSLVEDGTPLAGVPITWELFGEDEIGRAHV